MSLFVMHTEYRLKFCFTEGCAILLRECYHRTRIETGRHFVRKWKLATRL